MNEVINKLNELGYQTIGSDWYQRISDWDTWYTGKVKEFHHYKVWNGQERLDCEMYSLGMAKKVCEDIANLLMNERTTITIDGDEEQTFLDEILAANAFEVSMNELQERGAAASGTYALVPRGVNIRTDGTGRIVPAADATLTIDYITGERIFPLAWRGREITECAFFKLIVTPTEKYNYLQIHTLENGEYQIRNIAWKAGIGAGGLSNVELSQVPGLENVPEVLYTGSDKPQFVIGRLNIANNIDADNPMGIALFANAIDNLKAVDIVYDAYVIEYQLGKKVVFVKPAVSKTIDGQPTLDPKERVYHVLPEDMADGDLIHEVDMSLRSQPLADGVQDMLQTLGFKCGFGSNYYKFENGVAVTATETIYNNQDLQESVNKHKIVLRALLIEFTRILLRLGKQYMGLNLNEDADIAVDLDDSVFVNKEAQLTDMRLDVQAGYLRPEIYIAQKYGVTEEEALKMIPGLEDQVDEGEDEIE